MMSSNGQKNISVRSARLDDVSAMIEIGSAIRLESAVYFPPVDEDFTHEMAKLWLGNPDVFCVFVAETNDGEIVGLLTGACAPFAFSPERRASIDLFHVRKSHRGSVAAKRLLDAFTSWEEYLGAKMAVLGSATGKDIGPFARRFGFEEIGVNYARIH